MIGDVIISGLDVIRGVCKDGEGVDEGVGGVVGVTGDNEGREGGGVFAAFFSTFTRLRP